MTDPAHFDARHLEAVWGPYPCCILSNRNSGIDPHHILGRGGTGDHKPYSSILNSVPLCREIHEGPYRDHPLIRRFFLEKAHEYTLHAIAAGSYEWTDIDREFMAIADEWTAKNLL